MVAETFLVGDSKMRKPEFGLYCLVILFAWFLLFGVFSSWVCLKTFDKHAKIWNK